MSDQKELFVPEGKTKLLAEVALALATAATTTSARRSQQAAGAYPPRLRCFPQVRRANERESMRRHPRPKIAPKPVCLGTNAFFQLFQVGHQSDSFVAPPPRAHSTPTHRTAPLPRSTKVLSTRSLGQLNFASEQHRLIPPSSRELSPGCRAVKLSRLRRGAVEALSRRCRGLACRACRVPVEFLSSLSRACRAGTLSRLAGLVEADSMRLSVE